MLEQNFQTFEYKDTGSTICISGFIDNVKVDLVKHHYFPQIDKPVFEEKIRLFSDRDIMAMKVFAQMKVMNQ